MKTHCHRGLFVLTCLWFASFSSSAEAQAILWCMRPWLRRRRLYLRCRGGRERNPHRGDASDRGWASLAGGRRCRRHECYYERRRDGQHDQLYRPGFESDFTTGRAYQVVVFYERR